MSKNHNYFTIKQNGKSERAYNTALDLAPLYKKNKRFANYIVLGGGGGTDGGRLVNPVLALSVTDEAVNADIEQGDLSATYTASGFGKGAVSFCELSLCANADGSGASSYASIGNHTLNDDTVVSLTVFVTVSGDMQPTGGDNPLVRWLLGCGALSGNFTLHTGKCNFPQVPMHRLSEGFTQMTTITAQFTDNALVFEGNNAAEKNEILINFKYKPILRARPEFATETLIHETVSQPVVGVVLPGSQPLRVSNVRQGSNSIVDVKMYGIPSELFDVKQLIPYKLTGVSQLVVDPYEQFLAACTDKEVTVLAVEQTDARIVARIERQENETVDLLANGGVTLWNEHTLRVFRPDSVGAYQEKRFALGRGEQCAVVLEGNVLHAGRIANGMFERFKIDNSDMVSPIETVSVSASTRLTRASTRLTLFNGTSGIYGLTGRKNNLEDRLDVYNTPTKQFTKIDALGEVLAYGCDSKGYKVSYYWGGAEYSTNNAIIGGRAFMFQASNGARNFVILDLSRKYFKIVTGATLEPEWEVTALTQAGNFLFILFKDGSVKSYYINCSQYVMNAPDLMPNTPTYYSVVYRKPPVSAGTQTKIRVEIKYQ